MNENIIPKNIKKTRLEFWRGIGLIELLIILGYIGILAVIIFCIPTPWTFKLALAIIGLVFLIPLLIQVYPGVKGWYAIALMFKFLAKKKTFKEYTDNDTTLLFPYDKLIDDNVLKTRSINGKRRYICAFDVTGYNISLLDQRIQELKIMEFRDALKSLEFEVSFRKIEVPMDFSDSLNEIKTNLNNCDTLFKTKAISEKGYNARKFQLLSTNKIFKNSTIDSENKIKTRKMFVMYLYFNKLDEINSIQYIINQFENANVKLKQLKGYELINSIKRLFNPFCELYSEQTVNENENMIDSLVTFKKVSFHKNYFKADGMYYSINGIYSYPNYPTNGWGAMLANLEQTVIWNIKHEKTHKIKKQIQTALNNLQTKQVMSRGFINKTDIKYDEEVLTTLIEQVSSGNDVVKTVNILFLNYADNLKDLQKIEKQLKKQLYDMDIVLDPLAYRQLEYYGSILPKPDDALTGVLGHPMPCYTLANSFPFVNSGVLDSTGFYLGDNLLGDTILFDTFYLDEHRTNYNGVIWGKSGYGKSWTTYKEVIHHLTKNRRVIIIDPEGEYRNICSFFDGQYLNASNGAIIRINPFQIFDNSLVAKDENILDATEMDEVYSEEPLSTHLRFLTQFFSTLYKDLQERELRVLSAECQKVYHSKGITNITNISKLEPADFPTFNDLYDVICASYNEKKTPILADLKDLLEFDFIGDGQYAKLWNGHTTLELNNIFTVIDFKDLLDQDVPNVTAAQLYLILNYVKNEIKLNRQKGDSDIVIILDEAHRCIDPDNPVGLNFIYQMAKRGRKYRARLLLTTQNLKDFSGGDNQLIHKKTTAILNNIQTMTIMHLAPDDLEELCILFRPFGGISAAERENIARAKRGDMLFILSSFDRHFLHRNVTSEELVAFKNENYIMPEYETESVKEKSIKNKKKQKDIKDKKATNVLSGNEHIPFNDEWQISIDKDKQPTSLKGNK
ncbi:Mbov_0397 family ICE element conjugal transfer ATPase [Spiroplasma sp. SV19]|uniref:Mbov_0397 family ICE element conjugal transfer ATPase n=1 Tax=Spiroplasma sp. SV19 TaxID=2570468 RepID=UPI0024B6B844|nr:ATP-binding protein [Spiroplasma sp. SV19]WHQ37370.1 DUF87 domain-containing protein [Spiroplasma sp. SV19]